MTRRTNTRHGASRRTGRAPARARSSGPSRKRATSRPRTSSRKRPAQRSSAARNAWIPAVIVVGVVIMGVYLYPVLQMDYASQREVEQLEGQLEAIKDRNAELREDVESLKTPAGVEAAAREALGYVKPGEDAYVVIGGDGSADTTSEVTPVAETVLVTEPPGWWKAFLDRLFGVES